MSLDEASTAMKDAEIIPTIKLLLTEDATLAEILCNVLTLIKALSPSGKMSLRLSHHLGRCH